MLFGIGNVGSTLIKQIQAAKEHLEQSQLSIKVPVITNSKLAFFKSEGVDNNWETDFESFSFPYKVSDIITFFKKKGYDNLIAVDATASSSFPQNYISLIENGFHIVSANKIPNTLHYDFYRILRLSLKKNNKQFLYETNVGASLPIIETIRSLYASGETITRIKGVFSGSLNYIFDRFSKSDTSFSDVLLEASELGFTEPDARVDLSGKDVARKLLILSRELGLKLELEDVYVESLVPKHLNGQTTFSEFKKRQNELNKPFQLLKNSQLAGQVLKYVGELDVEKLKLTVKLKSVSKDSSIGKLSSTDNLFEIYTNNFSERPLIIQGSGAGKEVTARGLLSDINKLSHQLV